MNTHSLFKLYKCCVIVPTYNNDQTLKEVLDDVYQYSEDIIVVNDGSTDNTKNILDDFGEKLQMVQFEVNKGKGSALRKGFSVACENGYDYAITIDSDGQHFADDLILFLEEIERNPNALVIGARNMSQTHVPGKSSFGNRFSNFWFFVDTGIRLLDTQSGYRLYPIRKMERIRLNTTRFEFEVEVIVKAAWNGINVKNIPVKVHYEPPGKRITHFRPFKDFTRISILNTWLFIQAVFYYIPLRFLRNLTRENVRHFINKHLFNKKESVRKKALSIGLGFFMGIVPIWGYQMIVGLILAHWFKLNKVLFLVAANISFPPLIPFVIYGSYKLGYYFVANPRKDLLFSSGLSMGSITANLLQYIIGAFVLAFCMGILGIVSTWSYFKIRQLVKQDRTQSDNGAD